MGKLSQWINTAWLRVGNTLATPVRRVGETGNALGNILRQWKSSAKNTAEVGKQTIDALVDNFLNFSKVKGKRYEKMVKVPVNLVSACTRRPAMIAGAGVLSALNQWIWKPLTKLAPGKRLKWLLNSTRILSKKKWFDFAAYDTHETKWDTRVNQWKEKHLGFLGAWWSPETKPEGKPTDKPAPEAKTEQKKDSDKTSPVITPVVAGWSSEQKSADTTAKDNKETDGSERNKDHSNRWGKWWWPNIWKEKEWKETKPENTSEKKSDKKKDKDDTSKKEKSDTPKSISEIEKKNKEESKAKDKADEEKNNPEWNTLSYKEKAKYAKDFEEKLWENPTKEKVLERGKKEKKWTNIEEIMAKVKEEYPTMAGYIQEEILDKEKATV